MPGISTVSRCRPSPSFGKLPGVSGDRVWLVEMVSPFANAQNKLAEIMPMDMIQGPFRQTAFNLHRTNPGTGRRDKIRVAHHLQSPPQASQ